MSPKQTIPVSVERAASERSFLGSIYAATSATTEMRQTIGHATRGRAVANRQTKGMNQKAASVSPIPPASAATVHNEETLSPGLTAAYAAHVAGFNQPSKVVAALDLVIVQLGRLKDGWAGPETKAPTEAMLRDIAATLTCFPPNTAMPALEVDPEDGYVTLLWQKYGKMFALTFAGSGAVIGTAAGGAPYQPWRMMVSDEIGIASNLEDDDALGSFAQ